MRLSSLSRVLIGVLFAGSIMALARPAARVTAAAGTQHFGPFSGTTVDGSSCGPPWATDTVNREFTVHDNGDGTFNVTEDYKDSSFVTNGATSPGACETTPHHGTTVLPGISGNFQGYARFVVTSGSYTPQGCSTPASCNTTAGFVAAVFGGSAAISCPGPTSCAFNFEYNSSDQRLQYHHWQDKSDNAPGPGHGADQFEGDIATS